MDSANIGAARRYGAMAVGVAASAGLLALALRNVDLSEAAAVVGRVRVRWIPAMLVLYLADVWVRSLRWRLLLIPSAPVAGIWPLLRLEAVGLAVNNVVFLRIGELVRAALAARELAIPVATALGSIFVERVMDMAALALLFGLAAWAEPGIVPGALVPPAFAAAAAMAAALGGLAWLDRASQGGMGMPGARAFPRAAELLRQGACGSRALRSWRPALAAAGLSLALWLVDACVFYVAGLAIGVAPAIGYPRSVLVLVSAAASSFLPAVPGSFGAFEQAVKVFLEHAGVPGAVAFGYAGFVHLVNYVAMTVPGIVFLYRAGYSLTGLGKLRESP